MNQLDLLTEWPSRSVTPEKMSNPIPREVIEGAKEAVKQALMNELYMGTLTDSDMFKYTPAYTGDAWDRDES